MIQRSGQLAFVALLSMLPLFAIGASMDEEIDFLLKAVETSNCTFIRNGKRYDAEAARKHLQMKRERGKKYFSDADEFIENLASKSSWSGKPYFIQCGDDPEQPSAEWFGALLVKYRESDGSG